MKSKSDCILLAIHCILLYFYIYEQIMSKSKYFTNTPKVVPRFHAPMKNMCAVQFIRCNIDAFFRPANSIVAVSSVNSRVGNDDTNLKFPSAYCGLALKRNEFIMWHIYIVATSLLSYIAVNISNSVIQIELCHQTGTIGQTYLQRCGWLRRIYVEFLFSRIIIFFSLNIWRYLGIAGCCSTFDIWCGTDN